MKYIRLALLSLLLLQNCVVVSDHPVGLIYNSGTYNAGIYPHEQLGTKSGSSCGMAVMFYFGFGDLSVYRTAQKADIKKIHMVEYKVDSFWLFMNKCVVVYGE